MIVWGRSFRGVVLHGGAAFVWSDGLVRDLPILLCVVFGYGVLSTVLDPRGVCFI